MKYLFFILFLLINMGCKTNNTRSRSTLPVKRTTSYTLDEVKTRINQSPSPFMEGNKPGTDSIYFEKGNGNFYIAQCYYGNNMGLYLFRLEPDTFFMLDTIYTYWELSKPERVLYDANNNWFSYTSEGTGTNHYSAHEYFVRIKEDRCQEVFHYTSYVSDLDPENAPMTSQDITNEIKLIRKEKIVISSIYQFGYIKNDNTVIHKTIRDEATFIFSDHCDCFVFEKNTEPLFVPVWLNKNIYPE